mmetsp:Transcript_25400/g.59099  ORF Transcript_25400/g.59099 Transcript_25400/m.59099 type:complete len:203 (-) Transcript_25400:301-909(-)
MLVHPALDDVSSLELLGLFDVGLHLDPAPVREDWLPPVLCLSPVETWPGTIPWLLLNALQGCFDALHHDLGTNLQSLGPLLVTWAHANQTRVQHLDHTAVFQGFQDTDFPEHLLALAACTGHAPNKHLPSVAVVALPQWQGGRILIFLDSPPFAFPLCRILTILGAVHGHIGSARGALDHVEDQCCGAKKRSRSSCRRTCCA